MYESQISFTLDTICPWTYLAKKRLDAALSKVSSPKAHFTVKYLPYQLYPDFPASGQDKYIWYRDTKYGGSEDRMGMYTQLMGVYGAAEGITFKFGGRMGNTLQTHRVVQHFQEEKGVATADKLVNALYRRYFEEEQDTTKQEVLLRACEEAGIGDEEAERVVEDNSEGLIDVKRAIQEQKGNGIDSVPYVVVEGRRRDLTLVGAKTVEEYVKALETVIKES